MGGPCFLVTKSASNPQGYSKSIGPACTDNFQVIPFDYEDRRWHSVEQCYQAMKSTDTDSVERINQIVPYANESDKAYGQRVWREGQTVKGKRLGWDDGLGVRMMFDINWEKYRQHAALQEQLLATGDAIIYGGPSTKKWTYWNGLIQMLTRKLLKEGKDAKSIHSKDLFKELRQFLPAWEEIGLVPPKFDLGFR